MSHPSDRRPEGASERRFERSPDRRPDARGSRRPDGNFRDNRRGRPQDRPFAAGGSGRWGGSGLRGRRPAGLAGAPGSGAPERPGPAGGPREGARPERSGPGPAGRRPFQDAPRQGPRGEFRGEFRGGERRGPSDRWPAPAPSRFPGSRRPERPGRPGPTLRGPSTRPPLEIRSLPVEAPETESHAPAAPADLIWGRHSAQAALEAGRPLHRVWCTPEMRFSPRFLQLLREAKASGVLVEEVTWARLGQISGGAVHQGIVLQPAAAATLDLDSLIEGCRQLGESPLLIAVDGLTDPQNLGAIVRSAEALGAHGLVLPQRRNAGLTGSVAKVAAGALEHLPVARVVNLNRSLDALKDEGYRVIGLAAEGTVTLEEADLSGPLVLVTGSEGDGLSLLTRRSCDQLVRIPLRGTTPSLNASVATALLLYEVARRSWMEGLRGTAPAPRLMRPALPETLPADVEELVAEPLSPQIPAATGSLPAPAPEAPTPEPPTGRSRDPRQAAAEGTEARPEALTDPPQAEAPEQVPADQTGRPGPSLDAAAVADLPAAGPSASESLASASTVPVSARTGAWPAESGAPPSADEDAPGATDAARQPAAAPQAPAPTLGSFDQDISL